MAEKKGSDIPEVLRAFAWNLNAACNWEEETGKDLTELNINSNLELRTLLYCGIKDQIDPSTGKTYGEGGLTRVEIGRLLNMTNLMDYLPMVKEQLQGKGRPDGKNVRRARPTGSRHGPSAEPSST